VLLLVVSLSAFGAGFGNGTLSLDLDLDLGLRLGATTPRDGLSAAAGSQPAPAGAGDPVDPAAGRAPAGSALATAAALQSADETCDGAALPGPDSTVAAPGQAAKLAHDAADVQIGADAVVEATTVKGASLCASALPPLDQGMTNVTKGPRRGFRFLPHMKFRSKLRVKLPYDATLIPPGQTAQDVEIYYYDELSARWRVLERLDLNPSASTVTSATDHFTDMIAATITVPEHPETLSYNPTSIKDIKTADPGAAVNLVEAPAAGSTGDARLSYPIQVPPGRGGMQPQLAISYSSDNANGWLGVGWDLGTPAVTVDTRWGVPRYDAALETETYTLDGGQLTPVAHRGIPRARTPEKVFHTRVEGGFQQIVRHGNGPAGYWWEVTGKDGARSFFGGDPEGGPAADARLTDAHGNVFKWALRETRDLHGNAVRYGYQTVSDPGVAGGRVDGTQLYLRSINYTRSPSRAGAYTVTFIRDSELAGYTRRPDVQISARGGFKMVTAELLARVEVTFNGRPVRRYDLDYTEGAFRKTLLDSVTQRGADGTVFTTNRFDYFDDVRDAAGGYDGFAAASTWPTGADNVTAGLLDHGQASALSGSLNTGIGGHLYTGFNPVAPSKEGSAGAKVGFNTTSSDGVLAMVDLNGDNLPDKVFKKDDDLFFRLNTSGPDGSSDFEATKRELLTLPAIFRERSTMGSFGPEAYLGANVFTNQAETFTTSSTYFSDVNGDGLIDLVDGGRVLFNHLDANGVPTFTADSNDTPVPIGGGTVDTDGIVQDFEAVRQRQIDNNPLQDSVRRWVAPFSGRVQVTGTVALIEDTSAARDQYRTADGVRVAIQHDADELWSATIGADDYTQKTPDGVDSIQVQRGDHLYFRVGSNFDGAFDQVAWDPLIAYLDVTPVTDVNDLAAYGYRASADFTLAGRRGVNVTMPFDGTVRLTGNLRKRGVTTDDVTVLVVKNGQSPPEFSGTLAWDQTGEVAVDKAIEVARGDSIQLRIKVDSPIDAGQLEWAPKLFYTATPDVSPIVDRNGNPLVQLHPPYDIDLYPVDGLTAPQAPWVVPQGGTATVTPQVTVGPGSGGTVTFTVKRRGARLAKRSITVSGGVVSGDEPFDLDVTAGDQLFLDFSVYDPELSDSITNATVEVATGSDAAVTVPSALHRSSFGGLLALPYRGWTYAGYNANRARATQPIVEADLEQTFTRDSTFDPRTAKAYPFNPFPEEAAWRGTDELGYVKAATVSSTRFGLDQIQVPRPADFAGARAVDRLSHNSQTSIGGGVSLLSGSASSGGSGGEVDYLDLNGDRFPDVVSNGRAQYTTPTGALETGNRGVPGLGKPRESTASAFNAGIGGNPAEFLANARGLVDTDGKSGPKANDTGSQMAPLGFVLSAGIGGGNSDLDRELLDVNGDDLPDRVSADGSGLTVALNLGYGFALAEPWGNALLNDGASENGSIGASLGFNDGIYGFGGGASLSKNKSQTGATLLDLNGDGLLDRILPNGDGLRVGFNTGNGFAAPVDWAGALDGVCRDDTSVGAAGIDWDEVRVCTGDTGLGAGGYFTVGIPLCIAACYLIINPGGDASQNMAREEAAFRDVDGDGYADHLASSDDASVRVARNRTGRSNLLKSVTRPLGATIALDYTRDGNTPDQPQSRWVLSRTELFDGHAGDGADRRVTTFAYEAGRYDRLEREFLGYGKVTEQQRDPADGDAVYRSIVREFRNDSYYTRGLEARVRTVDGAGRVFTETQQTYLLRDVATGAEPADPRSTTATIFPQLARTDRRFFEGGPSAGKSTFTTQHFDALGNVDRFADAGEAGAQDDLAAVVDHADCGATYVVGEPTSIVVTGGAAELRRREATVDCATGDVTQVRQFLAGGVAAATDLDYFPDGNLRRVTEPPTARGQRHQLTYEYDPDVETHIARVVDSFGLTSTSTYDPRFGTPVAAVDLNNNPTSYTYDEFGRTTSVTGPYEHGGTTPTIRFEYHPDATNPWALTRHLDRFRSATDTIDTVVFVDGLKRAIQTKKDGTVHAGPGATAKDVMVVSGAVTYDFVGRTVEQFYPVTEPLGTPGAFNETRDGVRPTRTTFDVLDRATSVTLPDTTSTRSSFGFGPDRSGATAFQTVTIDANGHQRRTFKNVRDLVTSLQEFHTPAGGGQQAIWTSYAYDPLNQLVEVRDDHDNLARASYDNLGRRTAVETPDAGRTETVYDLASNPVAKTTANLRAEGKRIAYDYDFDRLIRITYPNNPGNNVTYTYGAPGAADNRAGRVTLVTDESGSEERFYGKLGEVVKEIRTIASDTGSQPEVYTSQYAFDTFGRLQSMIYPDGEVLTYRYDSGGMVRAASGVKGANSYSYFTRLEYDKFQERAFLDAGNGVRTSYTYDPEDRQLTTLQAGPAGGALFQNLNYTYDNVGNVLTLRNDVPSPRPNEDGGPTSQTFTYDDLDRLTSATGSYRFPPDKQDRYSLTLAYDSLHNLTSKRQVHEIVEPSGTVVTQGKTTYTQAYQYAGPKPHAASRIGERTFAYDANGNQTGWDDTTSGQRRTITWDEENRIQSVFDNGHEKAYAYDDAGQRVIKRGPQGETVYVSQYFTVRNRTNATKHVFAGTTRVVSKLMKQDRPGGNPGGTQPLEKDLYFFHGDHLGSSNYVTAADGRIFQHSEQFPSGEAWVDESSNKQRTPYHFAGKELDEETGLYNFGGRYYDPRTAVWQNTDPVIAENLSKIPDKASSASLNAYGYAEANPLSMEDPDGRAAGPVSRERLIQIGHAQGIGPGIRSIGLAFEDFARRSFGFPEEPVATRRYWSSAGGGFVVPDAVTYRWQLDVSGRLVWRGGVPIPIPEFDYAFWPRSTFMEVKSSGREIRLSDQNWQMMKLIDIAAQSPASERRGMASIVLPTVSDTSFHPEVLRYATQRGVALYQTIVHERPRRGGDSGDAIELYFGSARLLNPNVFPRSDLRELDITFLPSSPGMIQQPPADALIFPDPDDVVDIGP
jgi:RHS repeat-associated protein